LQGLVALRAMRAPPPRLLIESLLVTLNTIPANKVRTVVQANGLYDVRGLAVATLATVDSVLQI